MKKIVHSVEEIVDPTPNARQLLLACAARLNEVALEDDRQRTDMRSAMLELVEQVDVLLGQLKHGLNGVQIWAEFDRVLDTAKLVVDTSYRPGDRRREAKS